MIRWIRRLTLIGAGAALFIGAVFLPWATWNNLAGAPWQYQVNETALELLRARGVPQSTVAELRHFKDVPFADRESFERAIPIALSEMIFEAARNRSQGFFASSKAKDQPICFANAFETSGDYRYRLFVFRHRQNGKLLGIAGDRQMGPIDGEGDMFVKGQVDYELVENSLIESPYWAGPTKVRGDGPQPASSPIFLLVVLEALLLVLAAFLRSKIFTTTVALGALACGIYPLVATRNFVGEASKLALSGIVLDPAIGAGAYVMLAGGILAAIGGLVAWFEPARSSAAEPVYGLPSHEAWRKGRAPEVPG